MELTANVSFITKPQDNTYQMQFDGVFTNFTASGVALGSTDRFCIQATYDMDGGLLDCSSGVSTCNNPCYYMQFAEVCRLMKELQGDPIKVHIAHIEQLIQERQAEENPLLTDEHNTTMNLYQEHNKSYAALMLKMSRSRSEAAIAKYKEELAELERVLADLRVYHEAHALKITKLNHKYAKLGRNIAKYELTVRGL